MRIRRLNHSIYQVQYHLVWGTKYRRKILKPYVRKTIIQSFYKTQKNHPAWYFHKINTAVDHIHVLMEIPPKYSVAEVIQKLKANSTTAVLKRYKFLREIYTKGHFWSPGYFVSTIGFQEENIRKYIELQNKEDRGVDVEEEFS